jgi:hypothetical protein
MQLEGQIIPFNSGLWSRDPQPHRGGSTVDGLSPRWQEVSLFLHPRACTAACESADSRVSFLFLIKLTSFHTFTHTPPLAACSLITIRAGAISVYPALHSLSSWGYIQQNL